MVSRCAGHKQQELVRNCIPAQGVYAQNERLKAATRLFDGKIQGAGELAAVRRIQLLYAQRCSDKNRLHEASS